MVSEYLGENPSTATKRSSYSDIYTNGRSDVGSCGEWESFVSADVALKLIDYVPVKLTLISSGSMDQDLNTTALVCEGSRFTSADALDRIVAALRDTSTLNSDTFTTFACNNTEWKVGACSSGLPAVCVNCANPCLETGRNYTLNCEGGATDDALNVIILDFDPAILAPEISAMSLISKDKTSITAQLTLAEAAGSMVCAAYLSSLNFVPDQMFLLSLDNNIVDVKSMRMNFTITNLDPSSAYDVYCGTYSILGQAMRMDKLVFGSTDTQCCRSLLVTLASSTFVDNVDYSNALVFDAGSNLPDDLVVETNVTFSATGFQRVSSGGVNAFSQSRIEFSNASFSSVASIAYLQQSSGFYQLSVHLSGSSASQYSVEFGFGDTFEVLASFQEPAAPALSSAFFSADGTRVEVKFNSLTNRAGYTNTVSDCSLLFSAPGLDSGTTCKWLSDSKISVFLSGDGAAVVGDEITLRSGILKAKCTVSDCSGWAQSSAQNISIATATTPVSPAVLMSGSNELGPCDDVVLDISGSSGTGGRSWASVVWSVESSQANSSDVLAYLTARASVSDVALHITIPNALVYAGYSYNIIVKVCNFLGACGRGSHYFAVGNIASVPVVTMASAKALTVFRYNKLSLSGSAFVYSCDGTVDSSNVNLEWSIYSSGILQTSAALVSASVDPTSYLLPKYSLAVGSTYEVVLKAQHAVSKKYSSTSASISVQAGKLVAQVNVASEFGLRVSESVSIDAAASFDEDVFGATGLGANLAFNFHCERVLPSYSSNCGLDLVAAGSSLLVSVPNHNASFVDYSYEITVFVSHNAGSRTAQTSVHMTILPSLAAAISLRSSVSTAMNPSTKLALIGTIDIPAGGVATWLVDDSAVDLSVASLSPVEKSLTLADGASVSRVTVSLVLASNSLLEGSTYLFTLKVALSTGYSSSSAIVVKTNSPPLPGGFSVTPSTGVEMNTSFIFAAFTWEDVDLNLPLTYEFAAYSPLVGYSVFRSRHQSTSVSSQLAAGQASLNYQYNVRVQVFDILDGRASAFRQIQVNPQSNITDEELSNSLTANVSTAALKEAVHTVSGVVNSVSCDGAGNCTQLHREACGSVANKCGLCLDGYYGESEAANSVCYPESSISLIRRLDSAATAAAVVSCTSDSDCAEELMEECKASTSLCGVKLKDCDAQCSVHGACQYVSKYYAEGSDASILNECSVLDSSCAAQCVCQSGFAGQSCELSLGKFESAQSVRHLLLESYKTLIASENPTENTVISWFEGLAGVSAHSRFLSETSKELLVSLCSSVLDIASGLQLSYEDVKQVEKVLAVTLYGGASSSLDSALRLLDKYGLYLLGDLRVGQNPTVVVNTVYRLTAFSADGMSSTELSVGRSGLEVATGATTQVVTLPASADSKPFLALLSESIASMQSDASSKELYQSVPVGVLVDRPLCAGSAAGASCVTNVTLLNFEFGEHFVNETETHVTTCVLDEPQLLSYSCPSGVNVTAQCNGNMSGVITSNCSVHAATSRCEALSDTEGGMQCSVLEYSVDETRCQCTLPSAVNASWRVEYVSLASSDLVNSTSAFIATPTDDEALGSSRSSVDIQSSLVFYVVAVFVMYMCIVFMKPSSSKTNGTRDTASAAVSSPQEQMDDGLPAIFKEKPFLKRMHEELTLHHRWSCAFFKSFEDGSTSLRLFSVFTSTCFVFFLNSLMHTVWVGAAPQTDAVQICFLAACVSVVGAPVFVLIDAMVRQFLNTQEESVAHASGGALRLEYQGVVASLKEHAGSFADRNNFAGEFTCLYYL